MMGESSAFTTRKEIRVFYSIVKDSNADLIARSPRAKKSAFLVNLDCFSKFLKYFKLTFFCSFC